MKSAIIAYQSKIIELLTGLQVPIYNRAPANTSGSYIHIPSHSVLDSENNTIDEFINDYVIRVQVVTNGDDNYTENESLQIVNSITEILFPNKKYTLDLGEEFYMITHRISSIIPSEYQDDSGREIRQTINLEATIKTKQNG